MRYGVAGWGPPCDRPRVPRRHGLRAAALCLGYRGTRRGRQCAALRPRARGSGRAPPHRHPHRRAAAAGGDATVHHSPLPGLGGAHNHTGRASRRGEHGPWGCRGGGPPVARRRSVAAAGDGGDVERVRRLRPGAGGVSCGGGAAAGACGPYDMDRRWEPHRLRPDQLDPPGRARLGQCQGAIPVTSRQHEQLPAADRQQPPDPRHRPAPDAASTDAPVSGEHECDGAAMVRVRRHGVVHRLLRCRSGTCRGICNARVAVCRATHVRVTGAPAARARGVPGAGAGDRYGRQSGAEHVGLSGRRQ
mmetsp:Transcript_71537/g.119817  ORF Transcript_71537/g.119817 Transcript_71537/m.119817 type:complete len:304 (+) Transcript_71537:583-1494(+)